MELSSALQLTFSYHSWNKKTKKKPSSRQVRSSWCQAPSLIFVLIYLNTWLSHHHPPLSHRSCPTQGQICVLWPTPGLCLYHIPTSLTDRTDLACSKPSTLPVKGQQWKKPPRGPLKMDSWIKHAPKASFLSQRSAQALIRHGSRELPTVTSPRFPEQKGTVLRSHSSESGPPSNTVTSH